MFAISFDIAEISAPESRSPIVSMFSFPKIVGGIAGTFTRVPSGLLTLLYLKEIALLEKPFDLRLLAERIERVFPGMVKLREDIGAIIVMDKIKVTESGVVEGTGPSADRVRSIYEDYISELKKEKAEA